MSGGGGGAADDDRGRRRRKGPRLRVILALRLLALGLLVCPASALECRTAGGIRTPCEPLDVLVSLPLTGKWTGGPSLNVSGRRMAQLINEQQVLLPGYELVLHVFNDSCDGAQSNKILLREIVENEDKYIALGGTGCSATSQSTASIAPIIRMPQISWASVSAVLSDREAYPAFFRTRVPETSSNMVWIKLATLFGWRQLIVVKGADSRFGFQATGFIELANHSDINVLELESILTAQDATRVVASIEKSRVRVLLMITYEVSIQYLLCESVLRGVEGLLILTKTHGDKFWLADYDEKHSQCTDEEMTIRAESMIEVGAVGFRSDVSNLSCVEGMTSADYAAWWDGFKAANEGSGLLPVANVAAGNGADGVCMLALAVRSLLAAGMSTDQLRNRTKEAFQRMNDAFAAVQFEGVSGKMSFPPADSGDGAGDPYGEAAIYQVQASQKIVVGKCLTQNGTIFWSAGLVWLGNGSVPSVTFQECEMGEEPSGISCSPCAAGTFKSERGSRPCTACSMGTFSGTTGSRMCEKCPGGEIADDDGRAGCEVCPYGMTSDKDNAACQVDFAFFGVGFGIVCLSAFATLRLLSRFRREIKICDISVVGGKLIITALGPHKIWHWWRRASSTPVVLSGTGIRSLDNAGRNGKPLFKARTCSGRKLQLLVDDDDLIRQDVASSMGCLRQPFLFELFDTSGFCVSLPTLVEVVLIVAVIFLKSAIVLDVVTTMAAVSAGLVLGTTCVAAWRLARGCARTPMQQTLEQFQAVLSLQRPYPTASERGPGRAITAEQLQEFYNFFSEHIKQRNMYYICENLVLPITKKYQLSYSDVVGPSMVSWFVSHYWGSPFLDFVETLRKHSEALHLQPNEASYWVCTFSNNQWKIAEELGDHIKASSFYLALKSQTCKGTAMVIDHQALPLERIWCLFEVATTYERTENEQESDFAGLLLCSPSGVLNKGTADMDIGIQIAQRLLRIDLRNARSTDAEDKRQILDLVDRMDGGFKSINRFVRTGVRNALLEMHQAFENDFDKIVRTLKVSSTTLERMLSATSKQLSKSATSSEEGMQTISSRFTELYTTSKSEGALEDPALWTSNDLELRVAQGEQACALNSEQSVRISM